MIPPLMMEHCDEAYRTGYYHGYFRQPAPRSEFVTGLPRYQYGAGRRQGIDDAKFDREMQEMMRRRA